MTPKQFAVFLSRDKACYHCGSVDETLVPQHRKNRKMGGSRKLRDDPNNVIVFCSEANNRLESDADFAQLGREWGWKLDSWESLTNPVYEAHTGFWWQLRGHQRIALPPEPN
jgi:hypothetical protein